MATTTYTFNTGLSAGTPLMTYIDPNNKMAGTYNTGSTFYAGTPAPTGAVTPATVTPAAPGTSAGLPAWLQGDFNIAGAPIPKLAIYGGGAALLLLLVAK